MGGTLLKNIRDTLKANIGSLANANLKVQSQPFETASEKIPVEEADWDLHHPIIVLEMDVKGVYYDKVVASKELKANFAATLQTGLLPPSSSVDAKSVALDISKGPANSDGVPFL